MQRICHTLKCPFCPKQFFFCTEVLRCSGATSDKQMVVVLVGNKADQHAQREVAEEEGLNKGWRGQVDQTIRITNIFPQF